MYTGTRTRVEANIGVLVLTTSTPILAVKRGRREVTLVNTGSNDVWLACELPGAATGATPVAVIGSGPYLKALGGSWTTTEYDGAISGIADTTASLVGGVAI